MTKAERKRIQITKHNQEYELLQKKKQLGIPDWVDVPEAAIEGLAKGDAKPFEFMIDPSADPVEAAKITRRLQEAGCRVIE